VLNSGKFPLSYRAKKLAQLIQAKAYGVTTDAS
jgi:hypothetical protein